jgi:DNA-binding NarL/FixJ family response regulator
MKQAIRVAVIDDHPLFREGVTQTLAAVGDIDVIAQGGSARDAVRLAQEHQPDIIVLDINMPGGGTPAIESIVTSSPASKVLMLSVSTEEEHVIGALQAGAHGYVMKGVSGPELVRAIHSVYEGEMYLSPSLGARLLSHLTRLEGQAETQPATEKLSEREEEILALVAQGLSNKQVGIKLELSDKTVKHHMTNVFRKLRVQSRLEAALFASKYGLSGSGTGGLNQSMKRPVPRYERVVSPPLQPLSAGRKES